MITLNDVLLIIGVTFLIIGITLILASSPLHSHPPEVTKTLLISGIYSIIISILFLGVNTALYYETKSVSLSNITHPIGI